MQLALGLIETKGLVGAIEAADAMLKSANVKLIKKEKITAALITIEIEGEVAAVKSAVDAGAAAAQRVGQLISTHIIPRPDSQIDKIIKSSSKSTGDSEKETSKNAEPEISEDPKEKIEEIHDTQEIIATNEEIINVVDSDIDSQEKVEKSETDNSETDSNLKSENIDKAFEPEVISDEDQIKSEKNDEEENTSKEPNIDRISETNKNAAEDQPAEVSESQTPAIKKKNMPKKNEDKNFAFEFEGDEIDDDSLSKHSIDELRKQAILEMETEDGEEAETDFVSTEIPPKDELESMNVHQLRHLARNTENFPIKGREISKANRKVLLDYFLDLK